MTRLEFHCSDEKAAALLKAARLYDEGVELEPVLRGMWIPFSERMWACSNCRVIGSQQWKRCPVCEAKMEGSAEDA